MKIRNTLEVVVLKIWYDRSLSSRLVSLLLLPLSWFFARLINRRKRRLLANQERKGSSPVVIVVGNITVGGTGKTPLIVAMTQSFMEQGYDVAILSRGHGGGYLKQAHGEPQRVSVESDSGWVGDEPVMMAIQLAKITGLKAAVPVIICCANRADGLAELCSDSRRPDIVLVDDGLQHYALPRDLEIAIIDGQRGFGNGYLLPAGPLREPLARLREVDFLLINGAVNDQTLKAIRDHSETHYSLSVQPSAIVPLNSLANKNVDQSHQSLGEQIASLLLSDNVDVVAVAALGNPERFFDSLHSLFASRVSSGGLVCGKDSIDGDSIADTIADTNSALMAPFFDERRFPDHHHYVKSDFDFATPNTLVIMTAKDAVKCVKFVDQLSFPVFVLEVETIVEPVFIAALMGNIHRRFNR